jgi:hypothetical protein
MKHQLELFGRIKCGRRRSDWTVRALFALSAFLASAAFLLLTLLMLDPGIAGRAVELFLNSAERAIPLLEWTLNQG